MSEFEYRSVVPSLHAGGDPSSLGTRFGRRSTASGVRPCSAIIARRSPPTSGPDAATPHKLDRLDAGIGLGLPAASAGRGGRTRACASCSAARWSPTRSRAHRVLETSHAPVYYVPIEDVADGCARAIGPAVAASANGKAWAAVLRCDRQRRSTGRPRGVDVSRPGTSFRGDPRCGRVLRRTDGRIPASTASGSRTAGGWLLRRLDHRSDLVGARSRARRERSAGDAQAGNAPRGMAYRSRQDQMGLGSRVTGVRCQSPADKQPRSSRHPGRLRRG